MGLADKKGYVVEGKSRPRIRRQAKPGLSERQRRRFLEALAGTCNVSLSAQTAGVRPQRVYDLKARDASFRLGWDRALAAGYAELELIMLRRALHGVEKVVKAPDGKLTVMIHYSDRLGLALLKMHREGASYADEHDVETEEHREACERIVARLERLREQNEEPAEPSIETKARPDRLALIRQMLGRSRSAGQ